MVSLAPIGANYRVVRKAGRLIPNTANAALLKIKKA
jgi:hypothetical protein